MRRKLHRAVIGRGGRWSWFRRGFGTRERDDFGRRDGCRDRRIGGRVLSPGGGGRLVLRSSSGTGLERFPLRGLALRSLRTAPATPTRHHPPDVSLGAWLGASVRSWTAKRRRDHRIRTSFHARQANVSRKRIRRRRLQEAGPNPKRQQQYGNSKERQSSLRPTDPDTHPWLSPQLWNVFPNAIADKTGTPANVLHFFRAHHRATALLRSFEKS